MTPAVLMDQARAAGVTLWADGDALRYRGPSEALAKLLPTLKAHKPDILAALAHPDPLPPLSPEAASRRQKVLAMLARDGTRYATLVEDPNTDPVVMALATPDGTCELLIPKDRYDPFAVMAIVKEWERELDPLWWRVSILEPGGRVVQVDTPSGWTLAEWAVYAERYHGAGCVVTPVEAIPKPSGTASLDQVLDAACEGVARITPEGFRSLLSPEDIQDIELGAIPVGTLRGYAESFAEGIRSRRIAVLLERTS